MVKALPAGCQIAMCRARTHRAADHDLAPPQRTQYYVVAVLLMPRGATALRPKCWDMVAPSFVRTAIYIWSTGPNIASTYF